MAPELSQVINDPEKLSFLEDLFAFDAFLDQFGTRMNSDQLVEEMRGQRFLDRFVSWAQYISVHSLFFLLDGKHHLRSIERFLDSTPTIEYEHIPVSHGSKRIALIKTRSLT